MIISGGGLGFRVEGLGFRVTTSSMFQSCKG